MAVERRLAAILAADVVGYSRMMGADEAGTLARLRTLRREMTDPQIAAHGGPRVQNHSRRDTQGLNEVHALFRGAGPSEAALHQPCAVPERGCLAAATPGPA